MNQNLLRICIITLISFSCSEVITAQEVLSSGGGYFSNSNGSISYTIGEPVIETYKEGDYIITQGFQQSNFIITTINDYMEIAWDISVYPNPANDFVKLIISKANLIGFEYRLYDLNGRLLMQQQINDNETLLPFNNLPAGEYILKITSNYNELKSFQILKIR